MSTLRKLTSEQVSEAMRLLEDGMSYRKVADQFGVSVSTIQHHERTYCTNTPVVRTNTRTTVFDPATEGRTNTYNSAPKQNSQRSATPPPPKHKPNKTRYQCPDDQTPAEWRHYLSRILEGDGRAWNAIKCTAYVIQALDAGVKDQVIMDKTGLGHLDWFRKQLAIGEKQLWAGVISRALQTHPDLAVEVQTADTTVMDEDGPRVETIPVLALRDATELTVSTPAGMRALARLSDLIPDKMLNKIVPRDAPAYQLANYDPEGTRNAEEGQYVVPDRAPLKTSMFADTTDWGAADANILTQQAAALENWDETKALTDAVNTQLAKTQAELDAEDLKFLEQQS